MEAQNRTNLKFLVLTNNRNNCFLNVILQFFYKNSKIYELIHYINNYSFNDKIPFIFDYYKYQNKSIIILKDIQFQREFYVLFQII